MTVAYELTTPSTPAARQISGHQLRVSVPLKFALEQLALKVAMVLNATPQRGVNNVLMQLNRFSSCLSEEPVRTCADQVSLSPNKHQLAPSEAHHLSQMTLRRSIERRLTLVRSNSVPTLLQLTPSPLKFGCSGEAAWDSLT